MVAKLARVVILATVVRLAWVALVAKLATVATLSRVVKLAPSPAGTFTRNWMPFVLPPKLAPSREISRRNSKYSIARCTVLWLVFVAVASLCSPTIQVSFL